MTNDPTTLRLADRLSTLRKDRGWSLDQLADLSGVSRATLSRLEKAETSPTAETLGKLCAAHGLPLSRLMMQIEEAFVPLIARSAQAEWTDPATGYRRRQVSPPSPSLTGEVLEGTIPPGQSITYDAPPRPGQEHHLVMLDGQLSLTVGGQRHDLKAGDCLRYVLQGSSHFETDAHAARYLLVLL
ncbi:MAG: helix-turn-helix domain-containing protein [Rhodobacteraceae bacterium]|nr:helix-turn-helix domain-containing protein [Paracoccaceae bacterium]